MARFKLFKKPAHPLPRRIYYLLVATVISNLIATYVMVRFFLIPPQ